MKICLLSSFVCAELSSDILCQLMAGFVHQGLMIKIIQLGHRCQAGEMFVQQIGFIKNPIG